MDVYDPSIEPPGLGVRTVGSDAVTGELHDVLRVTPDLGRPAILEMVVGERAARFAAADLTGLATVVRVERASTDNRVEVASRRADGFRLSAVLEWTELRGVTPSLNAALTVGDRLLAALASLQQADNVAGALGHGAIAIDQVVVNEAGQLTLTDYVFGTVVARLQWPRERMWRRLRIAMPPAAGMARFDHRVDVTQAAVVICALLAGRSFKADEYPRNLEALISEGIEKSGGALEREERLRLGIWLRGATELEPRSAFPSAAAARHALRDALGAYVDDSAAVGRWLREARGQTIEQPAEDPAPPPTTFAPAPMASPDPEPAVMGSMQPPAVARSWMDRLRQWMSPR